MKTAAVTGILGIMVTAAACFTNRAATRAENLPGDQPYNATAIPANPQYTGNADTGWQYLVTGDYLKSGLPYNIFKKSGVKEPQNYLGRDSFNNGIPYNYTAINAPNGELVVAPNCLYCHAQTFDDKLIVGLGNSLSDYTIPQFGTMRVSEMAVNMMGTEKQKEAAKNIITVGKITSPYLVTASKGVNIADRLTAVLAAHRNPADFTWTDKAQLKVPDEVIPTDVPAWWLLKKKNGMFYNGFGRGDFSRFLMASNLLTVNDTTESREVFSHFHHVLAYIYSIQAPKFPEPINQTLAAQGKTLFQENCADCHGTYGENGVYPNLLIPGNVIKTDPVLYQSNFSSLQFLEWFKKSWFRTGDRQADLVPFAGYIAPPLDGVWITAPYFHNGSVPNLAGVLNSKLRPAFWARDFTKPAYDYDTPGWKFTPADKQYTRSTYNTTLKGYSNAGHTFGDHLSDAERKAVIEYLKTL